MRYRSLMIAVAVSSILSGVALAADWPQWRGPKRTGISEETGLLKEWPKDGPKVIWQVKDIGEGYSTPSIVGDRLYLVTSKGTSDEFVTALDAKDGKQVWQTRIGKVGNPDQQPAYPAARSTPTVDGESIYALGSDGDLVCLETASGKLRWQKNVRSEFDGKPGVWAYSESPLVDGDVVVCSPGGKTATLVALNKTNGEVIWKSAIADGDDAGYASAIVAEIGGVKQYIQFMAKGVVAVDAKTGALLWRYDQTAKGSPANIPTPVVGDDMVYSAGGRTGGGLVKVKKTDAAFTADPIYFTNKLPNSIGGTVKVGGYLYGTNRQGLMCVDFATGDIKWQDKCVGAGSICFADGQLYVHGEKGDTALVEATPEAYREKGRITLTDAPKRGRSQAWAYPAIAGGRLYIHDSGTIWCYDIKDSGK